VFKNTKKFIEKVVMIEESSKDNRYTQVYQGESGKIYNLTGFTRHNSAKIGDSGAIFYETSPSCGLQFFYKDGEYTI
jgi:uncharacterized protein YbbK (DUF523 family)